MALGEDSYRVCPGQESFVPECRVTVAFSETPGQSPYMQWARGHDTAEAGAFRLLGRAFEVCRSESAGDFHEALGAFLRGAMIEKEDLVEFLKRMEG